MKPDKVEIWKQVLDTIKVSVSPAIFSTWLSKTHLVSLRKVDEKRYVAEIGCGSIFVKSTIEKRYFGLLQDVLMQVLSAPVDLSFVIKQTPLEKTQSTLPPLFEERSNNEEFNRRLVDARIRPGFTFENFAVSSSNQMAHAAAEAVANRPGSAYNPLFIWGGVGVGKTHLMHAVAHNLLMVNYDTKIVACTGEDFTNDIVEGIRNKSTQRFRDKYRRVGALLIDDIQFLAGKDAVQDEFFHTFNAIVGAGGQVILTSDRPPSEIAKLEERLRSRFEAGLIVDIAPPDFELRCAIVQIKAAEKGLDIDTEIVHLIAGNIDTARKIEGFLIRIFSEAKIKNTQVNEELVRGILGKGVNGDERKTNLSSDQIIDAVCAHYNISKRAMMGKARARLIARPRQILMYLIRTELKLPLIEVGQLLGGRDHTTIIHGVDKIAQLASNDIRVREDIMKIKSLL